MAKIQQVSSSEFAGKFGRWAFDVHQAPVKVVNNKTGSAVGYFVSAREFEEFLRLREYLPRAVRASELGDDIIAELKKPLPNDYPDLEHLLKD
jgi:hypothetical protein